MSLFAAVGRFSYRHRRAVLGLWVVAFAAGLAGSIKLPPELKGGGFSNPSTPSVRANGLMQSRLHVGMSHITVVFTSQTLDALGSEFRSLETQALARITPATVPHLHAVLTAASTGDGALISRSGTESLALLNFDAPIETVQRELPLIRSLLRPTALRTYLTGEPAVYDEIQRTSASDLRRAESYTFPVALFVLLLIFGTLVAAGLPIVGGGMAVTVTLGTLYLLAQVVDLSIFVMNTATMLGLAVGIDYSLFMVGRFREELAGEKTVADAVEATVRHAGRSIFFSGLAVLVGVLGLTAIPFMSMRSIGIGASLVVFFSVLAALTLLPAVLGVLGPRINALPVFWRAGRQGRFWRRWSDWVMSHPVPILVGTIALVFFVAWPVLRIQLDVPTAATLPPSASARRGYDVVQRDFDPSAISPIEVMLTWTGNQDPFAPANLRRLYTFGRRLQAAPGVAAVTSVVNSPGAGSYVALDRFWSIVHQGKVPPLASGSFFPGFLSPFLSDLYLYQERQAIQRLVASTTAPGIVLFRAAPAALPDSSAAQALAARIVGWNPPPGMRIHVAGISAGINDYLRLLFSRFAGIVAFVVVVTYIVLLLLLRSVLLPLKAVIVNMLSLLAAFGALVWVFQSGHLEWLLGFKATGAVDADLPILLFCSVFGISMDYEVFLLTRMREAWVETGDNQASVGFGLASTGRIVTSAALIIVVVTGSFVFTGIVVTKAIGLGLAVAVALDATAIRILMVPAAMRLLGRWNWWLPGWLDRRLPHLE